VEAVGIDRRMRAQHLDAGIGVVRSRRAGPSARIGSSTKTTW
jgi:hypothetical protein